MRLILLGAPGAGKGTQAVVITEKLKIPHISTGDIFRSNIKNGTELGKKAKEFMDKGMLVPDELTVSIVKDRLQQDDCNNGFVLDGFPRTIPQAEYLEKALVEMGLSLDAVINIHVDDSVIIKRMSGRRVCPNCGMSFHVVNIPPKVENVCDGCKSALIQRQDDVEETVISRLKTYHDQTEPLINFYGKKGKIINVGGENSVEEASIQIFKALGV